MNISAFEETLRENVIVQGDIYEMSLNSDETVSVWPIGDHNNIEITNIEGALEYYLITSIYD